MADEITDADSAFANESVLEEDISANENILEDDTLTDEIILEEEEQNVILEGADVSSEEIVLEDADAEAEPLDTQEYSDDEEGMGSVYLLNLYCEIAHEYDNIPAATKNNCVAFARYKVPSLPTGLNTLADKKRIINSTTPKVGSIAISSGNSSFGHVAYVEAVNGSTITTLDGGFSDAFNGVNMTGHIVRKRGTASELGIVGYWVPGGGSGGGQVVVQNPYFTNQSVQYTDSTNAIVFAKIINPYYQTVSKVGCRLYQGNTLVKEYTENCGLSSSYVNYTCNFNADMGQTLKQGTEYTYQMFAIIGGSTYTDSKRSFKTQGNPDTNPPLITGMEYYIGENRARIDFYAEDDQAIDVSGCKVECYNVDNPSDKKETPYPVYGVMSGTVTGKNQCVECHL